VSHEARMHSMHSMTCTLSMTRPDFAASGTQLGSTARCRCRSVSRPAPTFEGRHARARRCRIEGEPPDVCANVHHEGRAAAGALFHQPVHGCAQRPQHLVDLRCTTAHSCCARPQPESKPPAASMA